MTEMHLTTIRIPPELRAFLRAEARENYTSQNAEIIRAIRAAMKAKGPATPASVPDLNTLNPA